MIEKINIHKKKYIIGYKYGFTIPIAFDDVEFNRMRLRDGNLEAQKISEKNKLMHSVLENIVEKKGK